MPTRSGSIDELVHSVYELGRYLRQRVGRSDPKEVHMGQIMALAFISENGGITMKELSMMLRVTSPSATAFIDRLVKLGYVRRYRDDANRRVVRLEITQEGARVLQTSFAERRKIFESLLRVLPESDRQSLSHILRKILDHCPS